MFDDLLDLGLVDPGSLDTHRLGRTHRQEQGVTLTDELLCAGLVEHDSRVCQRRGCERQTRGHVGLDEAGDDVDAGSLGGEHQVDAGGTGQLRDALDRGFDVARGDHHEVGELVDDDQQVRVRLEDAFRTGRCLDAAFADGLVELLDVLEPVVREVVVAGVHFAHDPFERLGGLLRVRDDRGDQVRDAFVDRQLDALGVDEDHADLVGGRAHHDRGDHGVHEARLTGTGGTGDQEVGHLREVRDDESAFDVLAHAHDHRVVGLAGGLRAQHIAEGDVLTVGVRDLDTDGLLAGDRREDAHVGAGHGVGDVLRQRSDLLDLRTGAEFHLVAGDRRSAGESGDLGVDLELLEHVAQGFDDTVVGLRPFLRGWSGLEVVRGGQGVGDVAGQGELFDAFRQLFRGRRCGCVRDRHRRRGGTGLGLLRLVRVVVHPDGLLQLGHLAFGLGRAALAGLELRFRIGFDASGVGFFVADVVLVDVGLVVGLRHGIVVGGVAIGDVGLLLPAAALGAHHRFEI